MQIKRLIPVFLLVAVVLSSCSKYQKLLKSSDNDLKYQTAIAFFEKKDYYRALQLFDQLVPIYKGTERAEKMAYYYAYCYYYQEDYILASYYFKRFAQNYGNSQYAEECYFMNAYCNYLNSPVYHLDQTATYEALKELQAFANKYPASDRIPRCNELIDKLRSKLEEKAYHIAMLYNKMEDYQASIVSFQNLMKDYPDTRYKEEVMYLIVKTYYNYALKSVKTKREERFQAAVSAFNDLKSWYPESKYLPEGEQLSRKAMNEIAQMN